MRLNRRNVLVGLGTIVAGGGAALGTGAFSSVEAQREVTVDVTDDTAALIGLTAGTSSYVNEDGGSDNNLLKIDLSSDELENADGINLDGTLTIEDAFTITNNHDGGVEITIGDSGTVSSNDVAISFRGEPDGALISEESLDQAGGTDNTIDVTIEIDTEDTASNFSEDVTIRAEPSGS